MALLREYLQPTNTAMDTRLDDADFYMDRAKNATVPGDREANLEIAVNQILRQ